MSLTTSKVAELAPDQASLSAANKLMKASKWPILSQHGVYVWGECQGSGANPYRTVFDHSNDGYKCTCPSRKYPCKHVLALMWMYVEDAGSFGESEIPPWVNDWLGRRRKPGNPTEKESGRKDANPAKKDILAARLAESEDAPDPKVVAKRQAAAEKRSRATRRSISAGLEELQHWIDDQIRGGLAGFLSDPTSRCRTIAARLVDAKAQALASRLDELPAKILQVPGDSRLDALLQELGRIVLISRAWMANPSDAELTRLVGSSETRDSVLERDDAMRVSSTWEVIGEQIATRRDGLISQATWLLNLEQGDEFALLLDYFPATLGKRSSPFLSGEQFQAELVYYPAQKPLRAVIAQRKAIATSELAWPTSTGKILHRYRESLQHAPWIDQVPLLLPSGRITRSGNEFWWQASDASNALPIANAPREHLAGVVTQQTAALWDGLRLTLLSAQSAWGRLAYDG